MLAVEGWVSDVKGSELEIRLCTGPTFRIPYRDNLSWGESVRVCLDYETGKPGDVHSLEELALMEVPDEIPYEPCENPDDYDIWSLEDG